MAEIIQYVKNKKFLITVLSAVCSLIVLQYILGTFSQMQHEQLYEYEIILMNKTLAEPNEMEIIKTIEQDLPALPYAFLKQHAGKLKINGSCAVLPGVLGLKYHNTYWQTFKQQNITHQLFGAYFDNRTANAGEHVIRILSMINGTVPVNDAHAYCQLWFADASIKQPQIVPIAQYTPLYQQRLEHAKNLYFPHMLVCVLPPQLMGKIPQAVSLVAHQCQNATNALKVVYEPRPYNHTKLDFAVCAKTLHYDLKDRSYRIIEWLELLLILGVQKVLLPNFIKHENTAKALSYYQQQGFVSIQPFSLARGEPTVSSFQLMTLNSDARNRALHEVLFYNDCFYRNMYKYQHIMLSDLNELIMPLGNLSSWSALLQFMRSSEILSKQCANFSSLCFRSALFVEKAASMQRGSNPLHMLRHVYRKRQYLFDNAGVKCLHSTDQILGLNAQQPHIDFNASCSVLHVPTDIAQLQHFLEPSSKHAYANNSVVLDDNIQRFEQLLVSRCQKALIDTSLMKLEKDYSSP